jgi:3-methylcrotonyl-CoA carboxylase alpha subunit
MRALAAVAAAEVAEHPLAGFTLWAPMARRVALGGCHGLRHRDGAGPGARGGGRRGFTATRGLKGWRIDGAPLWEVKVEPGRVTVFAGTAGTHGFDRPDPLDREGAGAAADGTRSPMPGLVRAVLVVPGQAVAVGDRLVVLEAMKMEHALAAPRAGRVAEVLVREGDQVEAGAPLVRLDLDDG